MDEFNRYLAEAIRIRRTIQVYSEIFDSREAIDAFSGKSIEVSSIVKRSMHDEILISISRMFDSDGYETKNGKMEYLSQRNLVLKYESILSPDLKELRAKTAELWNEVKIKNFRDLKLAHNDKVSMLGNTGSVKHNVSFDSAKELVDTSITLVLGVMSIKGETSIKSNLNEKYEGVGAKFIAAIT